MSDNMIQSLTIEAEKKEQDFHTRKSFGQPGVAFWRINKKKKRGYYKRTDEEGEERER